MPIVNVNDDNVTPAEEREGAPAGRKLYNDESFKTSTLYSKDHELDTIVQYVAGSKWTVDMFTQLRDINEEPRMPDINVPATSLKYKRINNLIIHLESALDINNPIDVVGTGTINAGYLPSYGDAFTATLPGGREAVFFLTSVTKKRYNLHDIYDVEFKLEMFLDRESVFYRDLITKTMREYTYDINFVQDKSAPVILSKDYKDKMDLKKIRHRVIDDYLSMLTVTNKNLLIPKTNNGVYYDARLMDFVLATISSSENSKILNYSRVNYTPADVYTIYDLVLYRDIDMLSRATKNIYYQYVKGSAVYPVARHISYLGIDYISETEYASIGDVVTPDTTPNTLVKPADYIAPIKIPDNNYILSEAFYNDAVVDCGILEYSLLTYLRGELVSLSDLNKMIDEYIYWEPMDQYYLIPFLLLMIQDHVNHTYSDI